MTREWIKSDRRIGVSLGRDGLTWWHVQELPGAVVSDSGRVFGNWRRFTVAVLMYRWAA